MTSGDYRFCGWGYLGLSVAGFGLSASGSFIGAMFSASLLAFVASDILKALGK